MMDWIESTFALAQQGLFEAWISPAMFAMGLGNLLEDGFGATGWLLVGLAQLVVLVAVIGPLQRWRPAEPITDRAAVRTDILYTLIHRLGLFRVALFFLTQPLFDAAFGALSVNGLGTFHLDQVWPGVTDIAWVSLILYLLIFDFADYWIHRGQHGLQGWWQLHALHHSQRQMTMWSDNRNHLLDDLLRDAVLAIAGVALGVPPGQFVALVIASRVLQSLQHANLRLRWPGVTERLLVSPSFHRLHHAIGYGHEGPARGVNFAVLFPVWDIVFRTADWRPGFVPTGIRDQLEGRDYGRGFWSQQWLAIGRWFGRA